MSKIIKCRMCGVLFSPYGGGLYCSEKCSKKASNERHKDYFNNKYYPKNRDSIIQRVKKNK